jgi:hypothetical protein
MCQKKMPHVTNVGSSLTIIMDNGDQYLKILMSKNLCNATC